MSYTIERITADILIAAVSRGSASIDIPDKEQSQESAEKIASAYKTIYQAVKGASQQQ